MTRPRAPGAAREQSRRIINHLLGSTRPWRILLVVATLVSLGWFTDSLFEWLIDLDRWWQGDAIDNWWPLHRLIGVGGFIVLLGVLWAVARGASERYRPRVACDPNPAPVKALILYLSALRPDKLPDAQTIDALAGIDDFRAKLGKTPWRMPIEAIAHHLPRLERVILISSEGVDGSRCQSGLFLRLCQQLFGQQPRIEDLSGPGIDFGNVERLTVATDDAHRQLEQTGYRDADILIDVTGGQKTNSIAGAAVALAEGRTIQYVTRNYQVIVYDVTWDQ